MKKSEDVLYVVMPAYNEEDNIEQVVIAWMKVLKYGSQDSRLVIADSGSKDKTHDILLKLKKKYKQLEILEKTNQYHGPKVIALYKYAIRKGADYIFQTDSDGQTDPTEFESFWKVRNKYDGILGVRRNRGDGKSRAFVEKVVCFLLRVFFGVKVPDANAPFRLMKASLLKKYIDRLPKEYDLPNIILTAYFARFGENIIFKEISFRSRELGVNSINLRKIFRIGRNSLFSFARFRKDMVKMDSRLAKKIFYKKCCTFAILLSLFVMALLAALMSPSSPWNRGEVSTDSSVFLTIGKQIKNGSIPYLDTFDHKGPIIYIINFLGVIINETSGILIFEFVALFIALIFMYKTARLKITGRGASLFLVFVVFSLFLSFNAVDRGNLVEEYSLPLIAASLFFFLKYMINKEIGTFSVFFVGVCFAMVALLRLNMVAIWAVFLPVIFVQLIVEKRFQELKRLIILFFAGMIFIILPIMVWLIANGAFGSFIHQYLIFNISYSKTDLVNIYDTVVYFLGYALVLLGLALSMCFSFVGEKKDRLVSIAFLAAFIMTILVVCMSGRNYAHYGIIMIPLIVFAFACLYDKINVDTGKTTSALAVVFSTFLLFIVSPVWLETSEAVVSSFFNRERGEEVIEVAEKACEYISSFTNQGEEIVVYGNWNYVYLRCNRMPASKYSYQFPIAAVEPSILDNFFIDVAMNRPKVFVVQWDHFDDRVKKFLDEKGYEEQWKDSEQGTHIYTLKE